MKKEMRNMVSQKAAALEHHKKAQQSGMLNMNWQHLNTYRLDLFGTEEKATALKMLQHAHEDVYASWVKDYVLEGLALINSSELTWPIFIRACPLQPRPGVLESSVANNIQEATDVLERIIGTMLSVDESDSPMYEHGLVDPEGCIIIQRYIDATASCVISPNHYILMGADNDGITASKDCIKVALPINEDKYSLSDLKQLDIDPDKIELEFVSILNGDVTTESRSSSMYSHSSYLTQLRGSEGARPITPPPKGVTISGTFHGEERVTITHVHRVSDNSDEQLDLMEQALREGMPSGAVVIHPTGNHLSHHAGQCFKYGVPYIASDEPKVGEQWTQAASGWVVLDNDGTYEPQPYDAAEYLDAFKGGLEFGLYNFHRQHGWLSNHFHQFTGGPLHNPAQTAVLAGAFAGWITNACLAVSLGEARHTRTTTTNSTFLPMSVIHAIYGDNWVDISGDDGLPNNRQSFYVAIEEYPMDIKTMTHMFDLLVDIYNLEWSSGYGGDAYGKSTALGKVALQCIEAFLECPDSDRLQELVGAINNLEHAVHNNGCFFNKFMKEMALDWGTGKKSVSIQPRYFFNVYYAAIDVLTQTKYRKSGTDRTDVFHEYQDLMELGINYLRDNPLGLNAEFPLLSMATLKLGSHYRHPKGKYGQAHYTDTFIPCGVALCGSCTEHKENMKAKLMKQMTNKVSLPVPEPQYDMTLPDAKSPPTTQEHIVNTLKQHYDMISDGEDSTNFSNYIKSLADDGVHMSDKAYQIGANILTLLSSEQMILHYEILNGDE